jgi:predicted deacylase
MKLQSLEIAGAEEGPQLLITGGVHGDEFAPMVALRRLGRQLEPGKLSGRVTLIPVVNEPAFLRGCRTAEDGLDLARTFPGRGDGTVSERIAWALSERIRSADYYIDLHSGGTTLTICPLVGYMLHHEEAVRRAQQRMARAFGLPIVWGTDPRLAGRSLSVARDAGVPAIYAEYLGGGRCDAAGVEAYVAGCLNVMGLLGLLDRPPVATEPRYFVEDDRPESGHLQRGHPAPADGFFEPCATLGEPIALGAPLGTLEDSLGSESITIRAAQKGIVLALRTFPSVRQGDSLAVILETDWARDA